MACRLEKTKRLPDILDVEENLNRELVEYYKGQKDGFVQVGPQKWFLPMKYHKIGQRLFDFEVRPDDVWITGIPRSGTSLTLELVRFFANDFNSEENKTAHLVPFFERDLVFNDKTVKERLELYKTEELMKFIQQKENYLKDAEQTKSRRVIKTHLPFELLPADIFNKGCKVIYVCRYPKDVAVSYFLLQSKSWHMDFVGDFSRYWNYFQNGNCLFGPYFEHVKQGFEKKGSKNFLFVFYEDFRADPTKYFETFAEFLERPISDEEMEKLKDHMSLDNFRKNIKILNDKDNKTSDFIRKGKVGGWAEHFDEEMNADADKWIEENTKKIGFSYPGH